MRKIIAFPIRKICGKTLIIDDFEKQLPRELVIVLNGKTSVLFGMA